MWDGTRALQYLIRSIASRARFRSLHDSKVKPHVQHQQNSKDQNASQAEAIAVCAASKTISVQSQLALKSSLRIYIYIYIDVRVQLCVGLPRLWVCHSTIKL